MRKLFIVILLSFSTMSAFCQDTIKYDISCRLNGQFLRSLMRDTSSGGGGGAILVPPPSPSSLK